MTKREVELIEELIDITLCLALAKNRNDHRSAIGYENLLEEIKSELIEE